MSWYGQRTVAAERIRQVRQALKLRQLDLAAKFSVTTRTVMRWEKRGAYFNAYSQADGEHTAHELWVSLEQKAFPSAKVSRDSSSSRRVSRDTQSSSKVSGDTSRSRRVTSKRRAA